MKLAKYIIGLMVAALIPYCAESAFAWDTRWQFKHDAPSNSYGSGTKI